jgi:hypothetical protein
VHLAVAVCECGPIVPAVYDQCGADDVGVVEQVEVAVWVDLDAVSQFEGRG